jgi:4-amino-4-deoxy-L-arabinose transferase-like glycosyltransferase
MSTGRALGTLIVTTALLRVAGACFLGLGNDEAYHSLYAAHPSLGYYDHPPMMAWIEMAGLAFPGADASAWALRLGFVVMFAGSTWLLARLTTRYYGERAGFMAALTLNLTGYYGLAASTFALPDGPLLFFWLLTMDRLSIALDLGASPSDEPRAAVFSPPYEGGARGSAGDRHATPPSTRVSSLLPWFWVGLAWGAAMLSKYHGIFLPMGAALYLVLHRPARRWLAHPGPYLATAVGLFVFSPVIVWNATHGWASFLFQGGRAALSNVLRPDQLMLALLAQAMYLFPWIWVPLIAILFIGCRNWRRIGEIDRLWLALAVAPLGVFTMVACFRPVLPHWGLIGLVSLFPLLGRKWLQRTETRPQQTRRMLVACAGFSVAFLAFTIVEYRYGILQRDRDGRGGLIDATRDPTLDLYGWDQVAREIHSHGLVEKPGTFLFTRFWYQSAQLAHALDGKHPVLCYNADDPRGFAFWSKPDDWVGHDGVLVVVGEHEAMARYYRRWFARVEPVSDFWVERQGKPVRRIGIYRCTRQRVAYPFTRESETRLARSAAL